MPHNAIPHNSIAGRSGALLVIDIQCGGAEPVSTSGIAIMDGFDRVVANAERIVGAARSAGLPVIFFQEVHRPGGVDFGRELDGAEGVHCVEGAPGTELWPTLRPGPDDYFIPKRRYSCFFGTDLDILLKGLGADTLYLIGALTDVCVHYTFVDAHQRDFHCRVVEDCVIGSSVEAHNGALAAMRYLQTDSPVTTPGLLDDLETRALTTVGAGSDR
jgi:nicotinamidase-related amidase